VRQAGAAALAQEVTLAVSGIWRRRWVWSQCCAAVFLPDMKKPWMSCKHGDT